MTAKYEVYKDIDGAWRWRLRAENGQVTATSGEGFVSRWSARRAVRAVKKSSSEASSE